MEKHFRYGFFQLIDDVLDYTATLIEHGKIAATILAER